MPYKKQLILNHLKIKFPNKTKIMEVSYIFYKELPVFDEKVLSAKLTENNEIEEIISKKDRVHFWQD